MEPQCVGFVREAALEAAMSWLWRRAALIGNRHLDRVGSRLATLLDAVPDARIGCRGAGDALDMVAVDSGGVVLSPHIAAVHCCFPLLHFVPVCSFVSLWPYI